jgi:hypothetical protein
MIIPKGRRGYWWVGTILAFVGVAVARLMGTHFPDPAQRYVRAAGVLLALGGLFVIMLGTRRKE